MTNSDNIYVLLSNICGLLEAGFCFTGSAFKEGVCDLIITPKKEPQFVLKSCHISKLYIEIEKIYKFYGIDLPSLNDM